MYYNNITLCSITVTLNTLISKLELLITISIIFYLHLLFLKNFLLIIFQCRSHDSVLQHNKTASGGRIISSYRKWVYL